MDYPVREIIERARKGRYSIYPITKNSKFSIFGANIYEKPKRFHILDDILILPPQFTPLRIKKSIELVNREPVFEDVDLKCEISSFKVKLPLVQSSMGSPEDWNKVSIYSAKACAEKGIIYGIGENVSTTFGYDKRINKNQPCLMERILTYLENLKDGFGGIVIQQNEEDAYDELWNKIYADKRLDSYIQEGKIAFEIKAGQGAKAGFGGERIVDRKTALRLKDKYFIYPDPEKIEAKFYERHSYPDIFTEEILRNRIRKLKNDYPRVKIWLKTAGYRDLDKVIEIAQSEDVDCLVIDGKEGGTGMSPTIAIKEVGLPLVSCLKFVSEAREKNFDLDIVVSGRLYNGAHLVKAICLGANGIAMGRPFLISCYAYRFAEKIIEKELYRNFLFDFFIRSFFRPNEKSVLFVKNFIESVEIEAKMLMASLGKYYIKDLSKEDIGSLNKDLAEAFKIKFIN